MESPLVTISVPVYNVEKYLNQCLDELVNQSLQEIEIILVDDGSTDKSGSICDWYASIDDRIVVVHKKNGGLASARQAALEIAHGEYFCACDADDWVERDMYEMLYSKAKETNADVVSCDYFANYPNNKEVEYRCMAPLGESQDLFHDTLSGRFPHMIWNKLIRRSVFSEYNIYWENGINQGEDFLMTLKLFQHHLKLSHVPQCLYHYRRVIDGASYTNNITFSSFKQSLAVRTWIDENVETKKYPKELFKLWVNLAFTGLRVKEGMTSEYYEKMVLSRIPLVKFVKYKTFNLKAFLIFATKLFGYKFGRTVCSRFYHKYYK